MNVAKSVFLVFAFIFMVFLILSCTPASSDKNINKVSNDVVVRESKSQSIEKRSNPEGENEEQISNEFWQPLTTSFNSELKCYKNISRNPAKKVVAVCSNTLYLIPKNSLFNCNDPNSHRNIIFKSNDNGSSWIDITSKIPYIKLIYDKNPMYRQQGVGIENIYTAKNEVFIFIAWGREGAIIKSSDEGETWQVVCEKLKRISHRNIDVLPSGRIIIETSLSNSTFSNRNRGDLEPVTIEEFNSESNQWEIVREVSLSSKPFVEQEFILKSKNLGEELKEIQRIRGFNKGEISFVESDQFYYEVSNDSGKTWSKVSLNNNHKLWVNPWKYEFREERCLYRENTIYVRESNSRDWKKLYTYDNADMINFTVGSDGYGYMAVGSAILKSETRIYNSFCNNNN